MDEAALLGCIGWVAHGFEIVHSLFPGWRFAAADTVAAFALHGAYRMGPRVPVDRMPASDWLDALTRFEISLYRGEALVDRGQAVNVLDGPLSALRHLNDLLATDPHNPPLAAGDIITTGTVTRAFPVEPGQTWRTALHGINLPPMTIHFAS
jgi:2-oxo-3-hexenedioate decarboxylase